MYKSGGENLTKWFEIISWKSWCAHAHICATKCMYAVQTSGIRFRTVLSTSLTHSLYFSLSLSHSTRVSHQRIERNPCSFLFLFFRNSHWFAVYFRSHSFFLYFKAVLLPLHFLFVSTVLRLGYLSLSKCVSIAASIIHAWADGIVRSSGCRHVERREF